MRSDHRPGLARLSAAALAGTCLLTLAVACSGGGQPHPAGTADGRQSSAAAAATRVPAPATIGGALNQRGAVAAYSAEIAPGYPVALRVADALAYHRVTAAAEVASFRAGLSRSLASIGIVTAFPAGSNAAFAAYRAQARSLVASLARPAAVTASEGTRKRAAMDLYTFAQRIGALGFDLNMVPATQPGGKH